MANIEPTRPSDDELVEAFRQLSQLIQQAQIARDELIGVGAILRDRGIDPNTYTTGDGDSLTIDQETPA